MQNITITGWLSRDAETAQTQGGKDVTRWNVPVKQGYGENEQTNWFRVSIWGNRAGYASKARKGDFATIIGELKIGEYNGKPQYEIDAREFHYVSSAPKAKQGAGSDTGASGGWQGGGAGFGGGFADDLDDDVPFATCDPRFEGKVF